MDDALRVAQIACDAATAAGADCADASVERSRELTVAVEKNAIKSSDSRHWAAVSVRAFYRGGTGWSRCSGLTEASAQEAGRRAAEMARATEPDPGFLDLASPAPYPEVAGLFDPKLAEISAAKVASWITRNIDAAREVADDVLVSGSAQAGWREWALVNSLGVNVSQRSTRASLTVQVVIKRGDDVGSYYEWDAARTLAELNPKNVGTAATTEALRYLESQTMKTTTLPVVLGPLAAGSFLQGLCAAASAEEVQRNRSFLVGKKGERIASEHLTLVDDALIRGGLSSGVSDGDGCPHRRVTLVEHGVLKTYLHNHYTSRKSGEANTSHSTRGGVAPTNVIPALGIKTAAQMIAEVNDGIYIALGRPQPDTASGRVSALVDAGFRIKNGQLTYPLRNTMVAGHGLELLANIDAVSSDFRAEPGRVLPTLRLLNVRVASGE